MSRPYLETLRRAPVAWHPLSAPRSVQEQVEVLYRYKPAGMQPRTRQPCCPQEAPARYLQQYLALHPLGGIATRRRAALEPIRLKQSLLSSPRFLSPAKRPPTPPCFVFPIHCLSFFVRLRRNLQVLFPRPPSLSSSFPLPFTLQSIAIPLIRQTPARRRGSLPFSTSRPPALLASRVNAALSRTPAFFMT